MKWTKERHDAARARVEELERTTVSCSKRLPEHRGEYLGYFPKSSGRNGWTKVRWDGRAWFRHHTETDEITHWREYPPRPVRSGPRRTGDGA